MKIKFKIEAIIFCAIMVIMILFGCCIVAFILVKTSFLFIDIAQVIFGLFIIVWGITFWLFGLVQFIKDDVIIVDLEDVRQRELKDEMKKKFELFMLKEFGKLYD